MTTPVNPIELFTPFLPTTYNVPEEADRLKPFLVDKFSNFADVINDKKIGIYIQATEALNGEKWFYKLTSKTRNGYQAIAYIPSFPNNTTLTLSSTNPTLGAPFFPVNNINKQFVVTHVWGSASLPPTTPGTGNYFSFNAQGDSRVSFTMSDTTIVITTTTDLSGYSGFIVVEYLRDGI